MLPSVNQHLTIIFLDFEKTTRSSNLTVGFNFRGGGPTGSDVTTGSMDFNAVAGAPTLAQRYWGNLNSDYFLDSGSIPARYFDSFGDLVGNGNNTNNGLRIEFDGSLLWSNGLSATNGNSKLMWGYMDDGYAELLQPYIQLRNIPYAKYDIIVYVDGDGNNGSKCGPYWLEEATDPIDADGTDLTPLVYTEQIGSPHFDGTFVQVPLTSNSAASADAGNYIIFDGMTQSDITIRGLKTTGTRAPINAFQIVDRTPPFVPGPEYPVRTILLLR